MEPCVKAAPRPDRCGQCQALLPANRICKLLKKCIVCLVRNADLAAKKYKHQKDSP